MRSASAATRYGREHTKVFTPLLKKLVNELGDDLYAHMCASDLTVNVSGGQPELHRAWRQLVVAGFRGPETDRPKEGQPHWSGWFRHSVNSECKVFMSFSSKVCVRVQIGTKVETREVPIYETRCGDAVANEEVQS